jgi:hypothetical protein
VSPVSSPRVTPDPEVGRLFRERFVAPARAAVRELLERGVGRGEVHPDVDLEVVIDELLGAIWYRALISEDGSTIPMPRAWRPPWGRGSRRANARPTSGSGRTPRHGGRADHRPVRWRRAARLTLVSDAKVGSGAEDSIGLLGALSIGIGGIVGGGIFATLGLAVGDARGSAWLSFLVAGIVALLTAYSYSKLSIAFPSTGGTIAFLNRGFGTGFLSERLSTLLVLSYIVIMALYANAFATYAALLLAERLDPPAAMARGRRADPAGRGERRHPGGHGSLGRCAQRRQAGGARSLHRAGTLQRGLTLGRLGSASWVGPVDIFVTGMLIFLSYEGFELIANASPRVANRAHTLPVAFYGSVAVAMLLYISIVVVSVGHLPF